MPAWSGLWNHEVGSATGYSLPTRNPDLTQISRVLAKPGNRTTAVLFQALIGADTGGSASRTRKRVGHYANNADQSGQVPLETVTEINRTTVAGDVTALKAVAKIKTSRPVYPKDLSGNGGPALA